jgi:hypothetical protein
MAGKSVLTSLADVLPLSILSLLPLLQMHMKFHHPGAADRN